MAVLSQLARIPKIIPFAHLWSEEISDLLYLRLHSGGVQHCREENTDIYVFRISDLIKDIERNGPIVGIGEPEALKKNLQGYYSRRINGKDRLVYKVNGNQIYISQCRGHYED